VEVNIDKTKMMVFNKRKRKSEENEWKREGRNVEGESEFKYLGYTFNERVMDRAHVQEVVRKAIKVVGWMKEIWKRRQRI
jgi:hypothetical protein